MSVIMYNYC